VDAEVPPVCIRIAGNTWVPALLAIRAKGYRLWLDYHERDDPKHPWHPCQLDYQAEKGGAYFSATTPVELLGLIAMWEVRGDDWRPKAGEGRIEDELHESARTFGPDPDEPEDE
jgi:hypothetical protein